MTSKPQKPVIGASVSHELKMILWADNHRWETHETEQQRLVALRTSVDEYADKLAALERSQAAPANAELAAKIEALLERLRTEAGNRKFGHVPKEYTPDEVRFINAAISYDIGLIDTYKKRILRAFVDSHSTKAPPAEQVEAEG